ncbi:hypothetical protein TELCIR_14607, partial [Teladorsagia circumcincta]
MIAEPSPDGVFFPLYGEGDVDVNVGVDESTSLALTTAVVDAARMYSDIESFSSDERGHAKKACLVPLYEFTTNKPMMEKKRRARINHCLSELKEILICDKHA